MAFLTTVDQVRLLLGDDLSSPQVSAEEAAHALDQAGGSVKGAAAWMARVLARRLALTQTGERLPDYTAGDGASLSKQYLALAKDLESQAILEASGGGVWAGGISVSDKQSREADADRVEPAFKRDQMADRAG